MQYRVWYSTESMADYIIHHTCLSGKNVIKKKIYESDASNPNNFHSLPDHIKQILYLDAPDLIVELDTEPIFSVEVSAEAGTGHNAFQRFARLAASVENNVPSFYVYPEAAIIKRKKSSLRWDKINPLIFKALEEVMNIYGIPALLFYFPSAYRTHPRPTELLCRTNKGLKYDRNRSFAGCPVSTDSEMRALFQAINETIHTVETKGVVDGRNNLISNLIIRKRRSWMNNEYVSKSGSLCMSPLSATEEIDTAILLNYLSQYEKGAYRIGELLRNRGKTILYKVDASFRGDPYPGALAAIDYLLCRQGKTFEDRKHNLVLIWGIPTIDKDSNTLKISGNSTVQDFIDAVKNSERNNLLTKGTYSSLRYQEIPRYYMHVRYGSTFSKVKHIRVYSYFADAIIFPDGALWRDG